MMPEVIEKTFSVSDSPRLSLSNIRGSVEIKPGPAGQISVQAVKLDGSGDAEHTRIELEQAEDGAVSVRTLYGFNGWHAFFRTPCKVDYTVQVPPACALQVEGVSNSASLRGVSGEIKVASVSGKLDFQDLSGSLALTTVSGAVTGERLAGTLRLETVSGGVDLRQCDIQGMDASTVSGNIRVETALAQEDYRFNSVSGGIWLIVPAATGCTLYSDSISGRVHSDLPFSGSQPRGQHVWQVGDGGAMIRHNSVSGGLWLKVRPEEAGQVLWESEPAAADEPEASPPPDRLAVLDRIERGEISVEEGLRMLSPE